MRVGSIVECVRVDWGYCPSDIRCPGLGEKYTVAAVVPKPREFCRDGVWLVLEEYATTEVYFHAEYFREIEFPPSLETSIKELLESELVSCK